MIKSLEKAMHILNYIAQHDGEPVSLKKIYSTFDLPPSTCFHILDTLIRFHYVEKDVRAKGYIIGPEIYAISARHNYRENLLRVAVPQANKLCLELQEAVVISIYVNGRMYALYHAYYNDGKVLRKMTTQSNLFSSACGMVLLAYMERLDMKQTLLTADDSFSARLQELLSRPDAQETLHTIRRKGYYMHREIAEQHSAMAVPILLNEKIVAAIGVHMPTIHFTEEMQELTLQKTKLAALNIAKKLEVSALEFY